MSKWHNIPYECEDANCVRTDAQLLIYSDSIPPDQISEILGIEPTDTVRKGPKPGRSGAFPLNGWFLHSEKHLDCTDIRRHLDWLLAQLAPAKAGLFRLQEAGAIMRVDFVHWSKVTSACVALWPEQMQGLADLRLCCEFVFAHYPDDDPQSEQS